MSLETYVVHVTKECNMNCAYCYETDKTSKYTWEEIQTTLDNIVKYRTSNEFTIEFLGGEPMLAWDFIVKTYNYLESIKDINVPSYCITTNGTILKEDHIEFLKANPKLNYAISMDGHKTSNQLRVFKNSYINTHDVIVANIAKLVEAKISVGVHLVTHPYNVGYLYDNIYYLKNLGISHVGAGIIESTMAVDQDFIDIYISNMKKISDDLHSGKLTGIEVGELIALKAKSDVRTYFKDDSNKTVLESYGRSGNDISDHNSVYHINKCDNSDKRDIVYEMRKAVFDYHNRERR